MSAAAPAVAAPIPRPRREILVVFSALMLAVLLAALDSTIVATALPTITADLGGLDQLSWVVTAYLLASTISTPVYGKLGDLYGRKSVFLGSIVIFLGGSALCGLSQNMGELIAFRGLQGIGGGGLIVLAQAIIGDVVSPRERGRYQGLFGAVFGVSSVAGPLIGGFLVDNASWRWIFYVNLPIGALALAVIVAGLDIPYERREARIDIAGTALLALGTGCIVLLTTLGGNQWAWGSWQSVGLAIVGVLALIAFVGVERRAEEPVLPLALLANRTFAVAAGIGFIVGVALFGATTYMPLFLQVVTGASATQSGLELLPLIAGLLVTSIGSGQLIARWGRYKPFPIAGTAIMTVGFLLLSTMGPGTSAVTRSVNMLVVGIGIGLVMQVLVLAVQNAVDYGDLGVATSGATFFRSIGGSIGVAVFGAIFSNRLSHELAKLGATPPGVRGGRVEPSAIERLPAAIRGEVIGAYSDALTSVFLVAAPIAFAGFLLAWLLPEKPLRRTVETNGVGEAFAVPKHPDSIGEIERALSALARRDSRERIYEDLARRAGVDLEPRSAWVLARVREHGPVGAGELAQCYGLDRARVERRIAGLEDRGLVHPVAGDGAVALSAAGRATLDRLVAARRDRLAELLDGWSAEQHAELAEMLDRLASSAVADHPDAGRRDRGAERAAAA
jgi:EmrB/QacA subfamily drug resistance transporter